MDDKRDTAAAPSGQATAPPAVSSLNKYVRPGSAQAVTERKQSQPLTQPSKGEILLERISVGIRIDIRIFIGCSHIWMQMPEDIE